jgi:hypothetical protein
VSESDQKVERTSVWIKSRSIAVKTPHLKAPVEEGCCKGRQHVQPCKKPRLFQNWACFFCHEAFRVISRRLGKITSFRIFLLRLPKSLDAGTPPAPCRRRISGKVTENQTSYGRLNSSPSSCRLSNPLYWERVL